MGSPSPTEDLRMLRKPHLRFSIRSLLILTTCVAIVVWWLVAPTAMARRFTNAVNQKRHEQAAELFLVDGANAMLTKWKPVAAQAAPTALTVSDLVRGRRAIHLAVTYKLPSKEMSGFYPLESDYRGIHKISNLKASEAKRFTLSVKDDAQDKPALED